MTLRRPPAWSGAERVRGRLDVAPFAGVPRLGVQCIYHPVPSLPSRPLPITDPSEVRSALSHVEERDRRVIELRYGLGGGRQHSRAEIGRLMGISRERVRQLEKRALDRLAATAGDDPATEPSPPPRRRPDGADEPSRRNFLRTWTLLLLQLRPAHVYELRARLRELGLPPANYRLLQALEAEGFLQSAWAPGRGAGPSRRIYSLTPRGEEQLRRDAPPLRNMAGTLQLFLEQREFLAAGHPRSPGANRG
jgi:PadR family transcriptional regulator, regulatory protein PadR